MIGRRQVGKAPFWSSVLGPAGDQTTVPPGVERPSDIGLGTPGAHQISPQAGEGPTFRALDWVFIGRALPVTQSHSPFGAFPSSSFSRAALPQLTFAFRPFKAERPADCRGRFWPVVVELAEAALLRHRGRRSVS